MVKDTIIETILAKLKSLPENLLEEIADYVTSIVDKANSQLIDNTYYSSKGTSLLQLFKEEENFYSVKSHNANVQKNREMEVQIPVTAIDIFKMLPEGTTCEVLFNQLSMSPSPSIEHQLISFKLSGLFYNYLEKFQNAIAMAAPMDVYFEDQQSVVQPDVIVILNENKGIIHKNGIYGSPDIIIEILSGNRIHDTLKKKSLYEKKALVKEYFIIDPQDNTVVLFCLNQANVYELAYEEKGKLMSDVLGCNFHF